MSRITEEKLHQMELEKLKNPSRVERMVMDELLEMGLDFCILGTHYLYKSIVLAVNTPLSGYSTMRSYMHYINSKIQSEYGISTYNKTNAEVYAIERAFLRGNIDYLLEVFKGSYDYDRGRVKSNTFIMTVRNMIESELESERTFGIDELKCTIRDALEEITDMSVLSSICGIVMAVGKGGVA